MTQPDELARVNDVGEKRLCGLRHETCGLDFHSDLTKSEPSFLFSSSQNLFTRLPTGGQSLPLTWSQTATSILTEFLT